MSDTGLTTDAAPAAAVSTGVTEPAPVVPAGAAPASAPAGTDPLGALPDGQAVFDRGYVDSIRREAQRYRESSRQYEDVFGVYEPQDRDVWFNLARTWANDPAQAARVMQQIASGVLGEPEMSQSRDVADDLARSTDVDTSTEELTPEKVKQMLDEAFQTREQRAAEQKAIDDVMAEVRTAGYDPNTAEGFMVLWNANNQTNGDIKAAADMVRGYRQSIIDEYVQGRSAGRVAMPGTGNGVQATSTGEPITNLDDARKAADNFLRERRGA